MDGTDLRTVYPVSNILRITESGRISLATLAASMVEREIQVRKVEKDAQLLRSKHRRATQKYTLQKRSLNVCMADYNYGT